MEVNPASILKHIREGEHVGEVAQYWLSMRKLPEYDNSRIFKKEKISANKITQGDILDDMPILNLPSTNVNNGRIIIFSSTCDIDLDNKRNFPTRLLYAPVVKFSQYEKRLRSEASKGDQSKIKNIDIEAHLQSIRDQKSGQILYLPQGNALEEDAIVFFDRIVSYPNTAKTQSDLNTKRKCSFSLYGWHLFMERMALFLFRTSNDTVELRLT